jgi:hypothetical protein
MLETLQVAWPVLMGPLGVIGTIGAFWVKERRDRLVERKKALQERREREAAENARFRADFDLLRENYTKEFLRLRDRVIDLEKMSARDQQLLDAAQQVNRDLTKDLMRLRAEVDILRNLVERHGISLPDGARAYAGTVEQVQ